MLRSVLAAAVFTAAAAVSAPAQTFDFDNVPVGTQTPMTLTSGGVSATFTTPSGPYQRSEYFDIILGARGRGNALASPFGYALNVAFNQALTTVSMRFYAEGSTSVNSTLTLTAFDGATVVGSVTAPDNNPRQYFESLIAFSGMSFTSIALAATRYDPNPGGTPTERAHFGIDDLTVQSQASTVPEPAPAVLLGAGLGVVGAVAACRRRMA